MKIQKDDAQSGWALWFISEGEAELGSLTGENADPSIVSATKRLEWLAGRLLLRTLVEQCGMDFYGLEKDEYGKPYLKNLPHQISLSHSYPYVAAQINPTLAVGIDLEQPKSKLLNIASRVLAPTELTDAGTDVLKHCVYWCAKEALYKSYGKRGLHFAIHLRIEPFTLMRSGELSGKIQVNGFTRELTLTYSIQPDYVLVCTKP
ncbi:MAG: 4'-phosphopantetheinyl transferase superfamily protein [Cyclobacteriaceae bacterium]|nr:4'-phosphopantetheinyl transferase superfamily protein [Cyclobacteriaceae bacterium]